MYKSVPCNDTCPAYYSCNENGWRKVNCITKYTMPITIMKKLSILKCSSYLGRAGDIVKLIKLINRQLKEVE